MRIAIVNLLMRTVRSESRIPSLARDVPRERVRAECPMVVLVADSMQRKGHDVDVFSGSMFDVIRDDYAAGTRTATVKYFKEVARFAFPPSYYPFAPSVVRELSAGRYDAVISSEIIQPSTAMASFLVASDLNLYVWQEMMFHPRAPAGLYSHLLFSMMKSSNYRHIRAIIPRTRHTRDFLISEGVPRNKIAMIVPNAVDCDVFRPNQEVDFLESHLAGCFPKPRILMVSRLDRRKGVGTFLEAARIVHRERSDVTFVLKGTGPDARSLAQEASKNGLSGRFVVVSEYLTRERLSNLIASCSICVVPSSSDLFPIIPLEAMACGIPVIASTSTHHTDTFSNQEAGLLVPPDNPQVLAKSILELIDDPARLGRMAEAARRLAINEFSVESAANRMIDIVRN